MSYLSIEFSVCFVVFFALYWSLSFSVRAQNLLLVVTNYAIVSCFSPIFAIHLAIYTLLTYLTSVLMARYHYRIFWLFLALLLAIINLFTFKYFDFFREYLQALLDFFEIQHLMPAIEIIVPIGISYYTFHSISYFVSLYKKEIKLPSLLDFALFLSFFPTLIAGPINRASTMLPQLKPQEKRQIYNFSRIAVLIILAVAKKVWLANYLAGEWVSPILQNTNEYHSFMILSAIYAYALQIFLDFSGYTDLMIALALLLGFEIPRNFDRPYAAVNMRDFWQRWHISLSEWIRDYIYIPLGGNRCGFTRGQCNLMIAMILSGLWHGASANFLVWGAMHGVAIVLLNISSRIFGEDIISGKFPYLARWITFHFVCLTWVFFYSPSTSAAMTILVDMHNNLMVGDITVGTCVFLVAIPLGLAIYPYADDFVHWSENIFYRIPTPLIPFVLTLIILVIIILSPSGIPNFIYASF